MPIVQESVFTHVLKNTKKQDRLAFIDAAFGRKFTLRFVTTGTADADASAVMTLYVLHRQVHVKHSVEASGWAEIRSVVASRTMTAPVGVVRQSVSGLGFTQVEILASSKLRFFGEQKYRCQSPRPLMHVTVYIVP